MKEKGYVGVAGLGPEFEESVSDFVVGVFAGGNAGANRFKSVRVGGGLGVGDDDTPSEIISILIGRPSNDSIR